MTEKTHVVLFSGGAASWMAAKRIAEQHGIERLTLLFSDTLIEDRDLYRFLIEGAANVYGIVGGKELGRRAESIPDFMTACFPGRVPERLGPLLTLIHQRLADAAMAAIPGLVWIRDGRTPWDVFYDERFLANSRVDPCSKILKRQLQDRWLGDHYDPASTVLVYGFDWSEGHRLERMQRYGDGWGA